MLWLKGIGALFLIIMGGLLGLRFSKKLELRKRKLSGFYVFIRELSSGIKTGEEIDSLLQSQIAQKLIYKDGINIKPQQTGLKGEDIKLLTEFFSLLGMGDTQSQVSRCEVYNELVKKRLNSAECEVKEKARLYSVVGFFSGLFVVILLI